MVTVLRDIQERGRELEQVLTQYTQFVKPAFEEFCLPVSICELIGGWQTYQRNAELIKCWNFRPMPNIFAPDPCRHNILLS